ncbi:MetQ/NlpA family ABC transporter substrate-binding protein [Dysosmobacter sp.]|uniref:MetQ/NlpA family ABC transporter substrate-binding protein n=1 Tax=Dysosmobacter sp. TaxID=2591382 RepID=UPI002A88BFD7|nr:MetQ/NlpA family ABC transporter substrate-binding protein [Dysosmobacter sp.]MDY3985355.1 MetQ/NlpA family ABC transporter substrate-binding protein [Dysosmobacter sp.]
MNKKFFALVLALVLALSLTACGEKAPADTSTDTKAPTESAEPTVLKVAASPTPHAEILAQVKDVLAEQGIDLQIHEYGDYVVPNTAVEEGDEDVNYFQHQPYLDQFNEENGTHLVSVAAIHYEPFGIYPCKTDSLEALPDGATVAVPNDATNEARALQLLASNGLIEIDPSAGLKATPNDITSNPKNLQFVELEAAMVPNVTTEVDIAAINGNYALQAGFSSANDAIALEDADSEAAQTYANIIVVKEGNENNPAVLALVEALKSDAVRDYINETYNNNVLPIF